MKVTLYSVLDHATNNERIFGITRDGEFDNLPYKLAMDFLAEKDLERYEYFQTEEEIDFRWDVTPEHFEMLRRPPTKWTADDYLGAVFFGNCKLEFCLMQDDGVSYPYCNMFVYGQSGYGTLWDGTPYADYDGFACKIDNDLPKRRSFESFARHIENDICDVLNEYHQLIVDALEPTDPDKWYSIEHVLVNVTRRG